MTIIDGAALFMAAGLFLYLLAALLRAGRE
ncbi:potassium-transporting ATPase subunit F [Pseudomonas sp. Marseille-QA0892]